MSDWWNQLRWSGHSNGWYAKTNDVLLFIPDAVYERHLAAYLHSLDLEPTLDGERKHLSEEERSRLYDAESAFLAKIDYWRGIQEPGVEMYSQHTHEKIVFPVTDLAAYRRHVHKVVEQGQETSDYQRGMLQGKLTFLQVHQGKVLTSRHIYDHVMTMLLNTRHPSEWNAGYIMGWTQAYHENPPLLHALPASVLAEVPCQQEVARLLDSIKEGELTLREAANAIDAWQVLSLSKEERICH